MATNKFNPIELTINSTANIIYNIGFATANASSIHILNKLLVIYFQQLCRNWKRLSEERDPQDVFSDLAVVVVSELSYFGLEDLKEFLKCTGSSESDLKPLPSFPVKHFEAGKKGENTTLVNLTKEDFSVFRSSTENFPSYFGLSSKALHMENMFNGNPYASVGRCNLHDTLDSLASPILALCKPARRDRGQSVKIQPKEFLARDGEEKKKEEEEDGENSHNQFTIDRTLLSMDVVNPPLKSVHSVKGIKLRLLRNMENTPPGFFSARSMQKSKSIPEKRE